MRVALIVIIVMMTMIMIVVVMMKALTKIDLYNDHANANDNNDRRIWQ